MNIVLNATHLCVVQFYKDTLETDEKSPEKEGSRTPSPAEENNQNDAEMKEGGQ